MLRWYVGGIAVAKIGSRFRVEGPDVALTSEGESRSLQVISFNLRHVHLNINAATICIQLNLTSARPDLLEIALW